jgi:hypothetical protein
MAMEETPRLERFEVVKYTSDHDRFDEGGTSVIENFYKSFSTLRHIVFDVRRTKDNSFEAECLMSYVELETCYPQCRPQQHSQRHRPGSYYPHQQHPRHVLHFTARSFQRLCQG